MNAVDISRYAVNVAEEGAYSLVTAELTWTNITERMTTEELESLFDRKGNVIRVKPWAREGITWSVGDVAEPGMVRALGPHDIVVANNFLCHMDPVAAEKCLGNIASLTKPGGYLFVAGIDLEVRSKVARRLAWIPVQELLEEIHEGDSCMRDQWPFQYGSLEPLNKKRQDWRLRYASVFRIPQPNDRRHPGVTEMAESTVAA